MSEAAGETSGLLAWKNHFGYGSKKTLQQTIIEDEDEEFERLRITDLAPQEVDDLKIARAAWYIEDAVLGVTRPHPLQTPAAIRAYSIWHTLRPMRTISLTALVLLNFVETPSWCTGSYPHPCGDPGDPSTPPTWDLAFLSTAESHGIESVCTIMLLISLTMKRLALGSLAFRRLDAAMETLMLLVLVVENCLFFSDVRSLPVRMGPYLRIFIFVVSSRMTRRNVRKIAAVLPSVTDLVLLLTATILVSSWLMAVLFLGSSEGKEYMPDIMDAAWNLLVLLTTANFPDVMMPVYSKYRSAFLLFFIFLCFALFFLMNVILGAVFNNYELALKEEKKRAERRKETSLRKAFEILDSMHASQDGWINLHTCIHLFMQMNEYKTLPFISKKKMEQTFNILNTSGTMSVNLQEFMAITDVIHRTFDDVAESTEVEVYLPALYRNKLFRKFSKFIKSQLFDTIIDIILLLNSVLIGVESVSSIKGKHLSWRLEDLEAIFTFTFLLEMFAKVIVFGTKQYWARYLNRFDMLVTLVSCGVDVWAMLPNTNPRRRVVHVILCFRLLRVCRLMFHIKRFRLIFLTWTRLLGDALPLCSVLFCTLCTFSVLGQDLFGGLIYPSNPLLAKSAFADSNYFANNFNDMASGLVTLFEVLVVNNWFVIVDGYVHVTSRYARWYFIVFYVIGVIVLLNVVVAYVLGAFFAEYEEVHPGDAVIKTEEQDDRSSLASEQPRNVDVESNLRRFPDIQELHRHNSRKLAQRRYRNSVRKLALIRRMFSINEETAGERATDDSSGASQCSPISTETEDARERNSLDQYQGQGMRPT